jgi:tetratricopeptide (TPR) repeat protein
MPKHAEFESESAGESTSILPARQLSRFRAILCCGGLCIIVAFGLNRYFTPNIDELVASAEVALEREDFTRAQQLASEILNFQPENAAALLIAGKCLDAEGRSIAAIEALSKVPPGQRPYSAEAAYLAGNIWFLKLHQPMDAETSYRLALREDPASAEVNERLGILLGVTGQWWRQISPSLTAIRAGRVARINLFVLALAENAIDIDAAAMFADSTSDPLALMARARLAKEDGHNEVAIDLLKRAIHSAPELVQAHVLLGTIQFESGDENEFANWRDNLPLSANDHPGIWVLRGNWASRHERPQIALRCYCEAVQRDPNHPHALYQAAKILTSMGKAEQAAPFLDRAKTLQQFINATKAADTEDTLAETQVAATLAESLGNYWEAYGWASLAASHRTKPEWAREVTSRVKTGYPNLPLQRTHPNHNPAKAYDYRDLPLPEVVNSQSAPLTPGPNNGSTVQFSFQDRAETAGINFQYFGGSSDVSNGTKHMHRVMGGGIAVLDFNGDDLPDIYLTQGGEQPLKESTSDHIDRLFLNAGQGRFMDVTASCGISENGYSQGVAVGDLDSDGFPDLLIANIGRNRLYHNNGDGTFSDISHSAGFDNSDWTTSCSIADLSGDGLPELYLVNYLQGPDLFTRSCGKEGRVCLPQHFSAADDRLYWNEGNGSFRDITDSSGINVPHGKGLGIVVGRFGYSSHLNVFVANDTVANFYFQNQGPGKDGMPKFRENALVSGLALNHTGTTQACMGVAAGDADGDGAIDLFVTNFHGEPNTLYRQRKDSTFDDETLKWKLDRPSLSKLGFGTQFLDADLDGRLDLIVANGHIDNFSHDGRTEYQMRAQFFENRGTAGFREIDAGLLGSYFAKKLLGRSMARLDWNRDGKEDVVVMHLDAPVALLENTTPQSGRFLALKLCGVQSNRDAIGAIVSVATRNRTVTRQLTAGDGFQASNERILVFGLGDDSTVSKVTVAWPSGLRDEFTNLPADSRWIVVEGRGGLLSLSQEGIAAGTAEPSGLGDF